MGRHPLARGRTNRAKRRLYGTAALVVILILGSILAYQLYQKRPNFYHPARYSLTEAALQLSESYGEERELTRRFDLVRQHLRQAISLLEQAARRDPADKRQLEALRVRMQALQDPDWIASSTPEAQHGAYEALISELNALAEKLKRPGP